MNGRSFPRLISSFGQGFEFQPFVLMQMILSSDSKAYD